MRRPYGSVFRTDPDLGQSQRWRTRKLNDPTDEKDVTHELVTTVGSPIRYLKIAEQVSAAGIFPYDGTANQFVAAQSLGDHVATLNTTALGGTVATADAPIDPSGLGIIVLDGNAVGDARFLKSWNNHASRIVSLDDANDEEGDPYPGWSNSIAIGDHYRLVILCPWSKRIFIKTEFENQVDGGAAQCWADLILTSYDIGRAGDLAVRRNPMASSSRAWRFYAQVNQLDTEESGYYHGETIGFDVDGDTALKVSLVTPPALGALSIWVGWA